MILERACIQIRLRIFQELDIVDAIEDDIRAASNYVWYGADDEPIVDIDVSGPAASGWATAYSFWRPALEAALDGAARGRPTVELLRGWQAGT